MSKPLKVPKKAKLIKRVLDDGEVIATGDLWYIRDDTDSDIEGRFEPVDDVIVSLQYYQESCGVVVRPTLVRNADIL